MSPMNSPSTATPLHSASDRHLTLSTDDLIHQLKLSRQLPQLLQDISRQRIILTTAKDKGITISDAELQAAADDFRSRQKLTSADQTWQWLQQNRLSIEDLETLLQTQLITEKLAHHLFAHQVEPHFAQSYSDNAEAQLYEIIVKSENLALELFYSLQAGETNFAALANDHAIDSHLRRHGGYRGRVKRAQLPPELGIPIFAAQPPTLLKPILLQADRSVTWHLIRVEKIRWPQLTDQRRQEICTQLFQDWLSQQVKQVKVTLASEIA